MNMKTESVETAAWTRRLFEVIDRKDLEAFLTYLDKDVTFRFGNAPAAHGKEAAGQAVAGFYGSIHGLRHELHDIWGTEGAVICHGMVTYTRRDGSDLTVPFANVLRLSGERIKDYLIFADVSAL